MPIPPEDSVYSYFMFITPVEQCRHKKYITNLIIFAVALVIVNFVMQVGLLTVVGKHIMDKQSEWVSNLVWLEDHAWYHVFPMPYNKPPPKCMGKDSPLCHRFGNGISCAPMSIHVLTDWNLLDVDGDGVWTRDEADNKDLQETVMCDFHVDLPSLFHTTVKSINNSRALTGRINHDLFAGDGIHKAYLNWYIHKPLLCRYGDQDMCGVLFERGFFDEALKQQSSNEFQDTSTALKYCNDLLQYECFDLLPSTYKIWRSHTSLQCGEKSVGQYEYLPPFDAQAMPVLTVEYRKEQEYISTGGVAFRLYLCILLGTFLFVMFLELRSIAQTFEWCWQFPADTEPRNEGDIVGRNAVIVPHSAFSPRVMEDGSEEKGVQDFESKTIHAVRRDHRCVVLAMTVLRLCLWLYLLWSGIMFLTGAPRYLALIFDALSLVFIFEIDELLYLTMLRVEYKTDHMSIKDMLVPQWHHGRMTIEQSVLTDIGLFFTVILFSMSIVWTYCKTELNPLTVSLQCLCSVQGPSCLHATKYSKAWWDKYWSTTLPASVMIIDQLKASG